MASPFSAGPTGGGWMGASSQAAPQPSDRTEFAMQSRPMGVKVLYSFKDSQDTCLARLPHILQIQTIPLSEATSIGVIDLRSCLQAIAQCSPEIVGQHDVDYTVYAYDYSEQDTPLVGQGMFSRGLEQAQPHEEPKLVTGRVTKNLLAIFGNGSKETLEVKLRLASVVTRRRTEYALAGLEAQQHQQSQQQPQQQQPQQQPQQQAHYHQQPPPPRPVSVSTPTDATEWNSFLQSNPTLGRAASITTIPHAPRATQPHFNPDNMPSQLPGPRPSSVPLAMPPAPAAPEQSAMQPQGQLPAKESSLPTLLPRARTPGVMESVPVPVSKHSRPSSRASRSRATGRPRGRPPKKKPVPDGNTSAVEEPTDADDGPRKKRAKTIKADWTDDMTPLDSATDSLRVTAAISGSLRAMRPIGTSGGEGVAANHLQEGPRAPTPVPLGPNAKRPQWKKPTTSVSRRESMVSLDESMSFAPQHTEASFQLPPSQPHDARSPTESIAPSEQAYTPEDSPADLGSSPPVPRSAAFMGSSPMNAVPSSPVLPPLPRQQPDSGFMSGGTEGLFDEDEVPQALPQRFPAKRDENTAQLPNLAKPVPRKGSRQQQQHPGFPFQEVTPGPPELLPVTSIYNPPPGFPRKQEGQPAKPKQASTEPKSSRRAASESVQLQAQPVQQSQQQQQQQRQQSQAPSMDQVPMVSQLIEQSKPSTEEVSMDHGLSAESNSGPQAKEKASEAVAPTTETTETTKTTETTETGGGSDEDVNLLESLLMEETIAVPEPELPAMKPPNHPASRSAVRGETAYEAPALRIPASDPVGSLTLPQVSFSEAPCPRSDAPLESSLANKNFVKKQTIKERLQQAIESGEMPPYCTNCGAVETPTWRKMWTQERKGVPDFYDYSEKPGQVTAIDILERDEDGKPSSYRLVKKTLGPGEDKSKWFELLLCNPCGIWLGKFKSHRPPDRWDKDQSRLNQPRKKRDKSSGNGNPRSKKQRTKSDAEANLTSEAYFMTDPLGPCDEQGTRESTEPPAPSLATNRSGARTGQPASRSGSRPNGSGSGSGSGSRDGSGPDSGSGSQSPNARGPGSTHSRGSGSAESPIPIDDDLGQTRRLLFPSPRKDGVPKVLGEVAVNIVKTGPDFAGLKEAPSPEKENNGCPLATPKRAARGGDDMADLFGTPPVRPFTPPPNASSSRLLSSESGATYGPFKTPTRPTPSHRPITRSISKSIRSVRAMEIPPSPSQALALASLQRTPSRTTPIRRTPQHLHAHFAVDRDGHVIAGTCESPFTATLNQLLSEANDFTSGSPSHGLGDLDLSSLPQLEGGCGGGADVGDHPPHLDFGSYLSTDLAMPSSPPLGGGEHQFDASWDLWAHVGSDAATHLDFDGSLAT